MKTLKIFFYTFVYEKFLKEIKSDKRITIVIINNR